MTRQGSPYFVGISGQTVGAKGLSMHVVVVPPGGRAQPHSQVGYETGIYLFLPEFLILSQTEAARAVVARNDLAELDKIEPYVNQQQVACTYDTT
jgi:uncharacterized RmlC-like cupin family protein